MPDTNTALKDLYDEYNPKLNLARDYSEFETTMKDPAARKDFYDSFNSELKLANDYNEFESVLGLSPKSNAPSPNGGGSGAQNTPYSSSESELPLSSWTTEANPLAPKIQAPLAKPIDGVEQTKIVQPKKAELIKTIPPKKEELGNWESAANSLSNVATTIKGFVPKTALTATS